LEQVIANPIVLPEESATFAGVGELVTVTGDRTTGDAKSLPPAFFRLAPAVSPVTVTSAAGATAPSEGVSPADGLTPEQQLDALLPIGTYLRMVEPDAHDRALLRLAYQVKRTTNATMLRVYGRDQQGRIRKNSRTLAWLSAALAEGAALTQPEATPEESDSEVTQ
jgi:hypothetical protein